MVIEGREPRQVPIRIALLTMNSTNTITTRQTCVEVTKKKQTGGNR